MLLTSENRGELHEVVKGTEERHQLEEYSSNAGIAKKSANQVLRVQISSRGSWLFDVFERYSDVYLLSVGSKHGEYHKNNVDVRGTNFALSSVAFNRGGWHLTV